MQVTVDGHEFYYESHGTGAPILFVHGFPLSGVMWRETIRALSPNWRCIVPDLRGHGRTQPTTEMSIARYADDLAGLLTAIGETRPVVLVGLSMGGIIALEFFRRYRPRLRALVLADARANAEPPEGLPKREATARTALEQGSRAVADLMIGSILAPGAAPALRDEWHAIMSSTPPAGVAAAARALAGRADSWATLPQIDVPTLVVSGESDALTPPDSMREIHARISGATFVSIANAGHLPPVEQPEAFNATLRSFLASLPALR